jgi:hypothetical protein
VAVVNGNVENLGQALERLIDLRSRELSLSHLRLLVAVHLSHGDRWQTVILEEGQQVVAECPFVVLDRSRP